MGTVMSVLFGILARYLLVTAFTLAYIEAGPGGEKVGSVVGTLKGFVLMVDWRNLLLDGFEVINTYRLASNNNA